MHSTLLQRISDARGTFLKSNSTKIMWKSLNIVLCWIYLRFQFWLSEGWSVHSHSLTTRSDCNFTLRQRISNHSSRNDQGLISSHFCCTHLLDNTFSRLTMCCRDTKRLRSKFNLSSVLRHSCSSHYRKHCSGTRFNRENGTGNERIPRHKCCSCQVTIIMNLFSKVK
jgi:hypothetical protein